MKKNLLFALMILITTASLLTSCTTTTSPRDFADRFIAAENKAWNTGDLTDLEALESADVIYHLPGIELSGWKAHADYILNGRPTITDLKQSWKYLSGEGNHLVLSYESSAVLKATDNNPETSISNSYLCVFRLESGKLAEAWMNGSTTSTPVE
jgi:hypothetical protein